MSGSFALFDWLMLAISVYVLYAGIVGKGRLYSVENIKEGKEEEFKAFSRKVYIFLGITMVINSAASLLRANAYPAATAADGTPIAPNIDLGALSSILTPLVLNIISYTALGLTLALIVLLIVKMRQYVDKNAQQKKDSGTSCARGSCNTLPSSAFEFDEDDKTEK
jgi:hypothetical protein